ncbi:MAG: hypothetical protein DMG96_20375 [Acidobacteria bacterium]|nr:MAG: hypothetical protein DMG96_20375 [Acidobacteriota bacterium]
MPLAAGAWEAVSRCPRGAKHLIGLSMPAPDSIEEYGSGVTLDLSSGGLVTGFSSCGNTPDSGVEELKNLLREAAKRDKTLPF